MLDTEEKSDVLSFAEGLRKLGVCRHAAYKYLANPASDFPAPFRYAPGGRMYYRESDIAAYLERKSREAQARRRSADTASAAA